MVAPFVRPCPKYRDYRGRGRIAVMLSLRIGLFVLLTQSGDRLFALAAYFVAYSLTLQLLRFGDCFQHSYDTALADPVTGKFEGQGRIDRKLEQANTFSNVFLSSRPRTTTAPHRARKHRARIRC